MEGIYKLVYTVKFQVVTVLIAVGEKFEHHFVKLLD